MGKIRAGIGISEPRIASGRIYRIRGSRRIWSQLGTFHSRLGITMAQTTYNSNDNRNNNHNTDQYDQVGGKKGEDKLMGMIEIVRGYA